MAVENVRKLILAFNRGVVSALGLARIDLNRMGMSAETQTNFMPRVLGSMMIRPGLKYIINTNSNNVARQIPFTFGVDDTAQILLSTVDMRVLLDDVIITRPTVASAVTNGGFDSNITSWTDVSGGGGTVAWQTGGYALLKGDDTDFGALRQQVTTVETNTEHALRVAIEETGVFFKVGSTSGGDEYIAETFLSEGLHSLSFTPTGDFWIEMSNSKRYNAWVNSVKVEAAGEMSILTPWAEADLPSLRWDQSGDIIYFASASDRQLKVERRGTRSWSLVTYFPEDGPFRILNTTPVTLVSNGLNGDVTLTASKPLFNSNHAIFNSLFRIESAGQKVSSALSAENTFSDPIRVVGIDTGRVFSIVITGTFVGTVTVQYSVGAIGAWVDLATTYTAPVSTSYDDGQDNQIIFYRIGIKTGDYTSGTATCALTFSAGSIQGIARIRNVTNSTSASAQVLKAFGSTVASADWWEGEWSQHRGYPQSVALDEGRLWWAGRDKIFGSESDGFEQFDDNTLGDSGPISRSIGSGPIKVIHWMMALGRLLFGTSDNSSNIAPVKLDGNKPLGIQSSSFGEPITPSNFSIKTIDSKGVFVDRSKQRLYELTTANAEDQTVGAYQSIDLNVYAPDFNEVGITQIAVQIKPDIRIHCVLSDGSASVLIYDRLENVICWVKVTSPGATGLIEDVSVLPGVVEDQVYYIIKRTINSATERHLCKWALESEAVGGQLNNIADSFASYDSTSTTTPFTTELLHLRDETVVVWADGKDVGNHIVTSAGAITLSVAASKVVAGLGYTAQFKSTKLASIEGLGLTERKKVDNLGFILKDAHYQGLEYGPDFSNLNTLPLVKAGLVTAADTVWSDFDEPVIPFGGEWDTDSRICLQATAPRPVTLLAVVGEITGQ